jgi:hypothetical protein
MSEVGSPTAWYLFLALVGMSLTYYVASCEDGECKPIVRWYATGSKEKGAKKLITWRVILIPVCFVALAGVVHWYHMSSLKKPKLDEYGDPIRR